MTERASRSRRVIAATSMVPADSSWLDVVRDLSSEFADELRGLFVEDVNALRSAALPFTQEVGATSGTVRPFEVEDLERMMEIQARRTRQSLLSVAAEVGRSLSFDVMRGSLDDVALRFVKEKDLLVLPALSRAGRLASASVQVLVQESNSGDRAREVAQRLASQWKIPLMLHSWNAGPPRMPGEPIAEDSATAVNRRAEAGSARAIVLTAALYAAVPVEARRRLHWARCPVIVVG